MHVAGEIGGAQVRALCPGDRAAVGRPCGPRGGGVRADERVGDLACPGSVRPHRPDLAARVDEGKRRAVGSPGRPAVHRRPGRRDGRGSASGGGDRPETRRRRVGDRRAVGRPGRHRHVRWGVGQLDGRAVGDRQDDELERSVGVVGQRFLVIPGNRDLRPVGRPRGKLAAAEGDRALSARVGDVDDAVPHVGEPCAVRGPGGLGAGREFALGSRRRIDGHERRRLARHRAAEDDQPVVARKRCAARRPAGEERRCADHDQNAHPGTVETTCK